MFKRPRSSVTSAVLVFNDSLNNVTPVSPILLSVGVKKKGKNDADGCHLSFILSPQYRLSFVSVVFDFNASLNDATPVSPILFPVDVMNKKE